MARASGSPSPFGPLDARSASRLVSAASDIALVMDEEGTILEVLSPGVELDAKDARRWRGRSWAQTVTTESRQKVQALIRDAQSAAQAAADAAVRWRQVNHLIDGEEDLPVLYSTMALPGVGRGGGRIVAIGRDLRNLVALQRRLVETQQAMERDYWRFREAETRYRHLFETSAEAVLIVDGGTQRVIEANPASRQMCGGARARLVGAPLGTLFDAAHAARVQDLLAAARSIGRQAPAVARLAGGAEVSVSASVFRQDESAFVLIRLAAVASDKRAAKGARSARPGALGAAGAAPASADPWSTVLQGFIDSAPDGIAFCDTEGRIQRANRAFLTLVQLSSEDQARGQALDRWLGRTGVEMGVLISNLRQRGAVGLFQTSLRGEYGATTEIEIAGSLVPEAASAQAGTPGPTAQGGATLVFAVRDVERRLRPESAAGNAVAPPRSAAELAELVGRTPLREIVAETTDLIEQLCIQTALEMTGDNRASAAQLLGLSRQSLYVKLRRFGLSDSEAAST